MTSSDVTTGQQEEQTSSYIKQEIWAALAYDQRRAIIQASGKKNGKNEKNDEKAKTSTSKNTIKKKRMKTRKGQETEVNMEGQAPT